MSLDINYLLEAWDCLEKFFKPFAIISLIRTNKKLYINKKHILQQLLKTSLNKIYRTDDTEKYILLLRLFSPLNIRGQVTISLKELEVLCNRKCYNILKEVLKTGDVKMRNDYNNCCGLYYFLFVGKNRTRNVLGPLYEINESLGDKLMDTILTRKELKYKEGKYKEKHFKRCFAFHKLLNYKLSSLRGEDLTILVGFVLKTIEWLILTIMNFICCHWSIIINNNSYWSIDSY